MLLSCLEVEPTGTNLALYHSALSDSVIGTPRLVY